MAKYYIPSSDREEQIEVNGGKEVNCEGCGKELWYADPDYEDDEIIEYEGTIFCMDCWQKYSLENFRYQE